MMDKLLLRRPRPFVRCVSVSGRYIEASRTRSKLDGYSPAGVLFAGSVRAAAHFRMLCIASLGCGTAPGPHGVYVRAGPQFKSWSHRGSVSRARTSAGQGQPPGR